MRKLFIGFALAAACFGASATCSVSYTADNSIVKMISQNGWRITNYDALCSKLAKANAEIDITGRAVVLDGKSVSWATVTFKAKDLWIITPLGGSMRTVTNAYASQDRADEMLYDAINGAIDSLDIDKGLIALNEARQKIKTSNLK